jgi:Cu-Zn family superoxide dismutase
VTTAARPGRVRRRARLAVAVATLGLAGCIPILAPVPLDALAALRDAQGRPVGTATFSEVPGAVRIVLEVRGLPPGMKGVHVHEVAQGAPPDFEAAGGHFNPGGRPHGVLNPTGPHAGDLPNLAVGADGTGRMETTTNRVTLSAGATSILHGGPRTLVVHAAPDDHQTDPDGNSGPRIACGVIVEK